VTFSVKAVVNFFSFIIWTQCSELGVATSEFGLNVSRGEKGEKGING